ncbi:hypothetical protein L7F22_061880 [Adiantum nelumboides]|nr:hypothetical protein [Adiantum nelumboides]
MKKFMGPESCYCPARVYETPSLKGPLAVWMATQPASLVAEVAKQDALLSHPSIVCQEAKAAYTIVSSQHRLLGANANYAIAVAHLVSHPRDEDGALVATASCQRLTDTNAAIVGGLLGAFHGAQAIASFIKDPVLHYDCSAKIGRVQPPLYCPRNIHKLMNIIYPAMNDSVGATTAELTHIATRYICCSILPFLHTL